MTENEILSTISELLDEKLKPVKDSIKQLELTSEMDIVPGIQKIETHYSSKQDKYAERDEQIERNKYEIGVLKIIVREQSRKIVELQNTMIRT